MRTVGVIAEYNPFHTGHAYHIQKAKELSGADCAVVVMSPDFVQRGEPAVFDKYTRARMALQNGADLVLELPVCYATASAEYFAGGAVALLDRLGVVDVLCFGAEQVDVRLFDKAAAVLSEEPPQYTDRLKDLLRSGKTYPQARAGALAPYLAQDQGADDDRCPSDADCLETFLSAPNNILGIEYCKAIRAQKSSIRPLPIRRKGNSFHSASLSGDYCSASAIRNGLSDEGKKAAAARYIPENCRALFADACKTPVTPEELLPFLAQKLLSMDSFSSIFDVSPDLSERICRLRYACIGKDYAQTIALLKSRQLTEARIRRALLHLILDIRTEDVRSFLEHGMVFYARVLGLRKDADLLLHRIKESCALPFLSKPAHAHDLTDSCAQRMWRQDLYASHLYRSIQSRRSSKAFRTEYELSPLILT